MTRNISNYIDELKLKGYTIIPNVLNENEISQYKNLFHEWIKKVPNLEFLHTVIDFNGIFKHHQVGHQRFAWQARTNPKIINIFQQLWNTNDLVTAFDGCCYYPEYTDDVERYWTHTDQSSRSQGLQCYQSFVSLTENKERTLIVYEGSHLLHEEYFKTMNIDEPRNWSVIDENYINTIQDKYRVLHIKPGDLVIWDSRTFHQNTPGPIDCCEERLVQYLCYLPKFNDNNTIKQQQMRRNFYNKMRTTSHWPYPINPVPEQPNLYNYYNPYDPIWIDYASLPKPDLHDMENEIENLL